MFYFKVWFQNRRAKWKKKKKSPCHSSSSNSSFNGTPPPYSGNGNAVTLCNGGATFGGSVTTVEDEEDEGNVPTILLDNDTVSGSSDNGDGDCNGNGIVTKSQAVSVTASQREEQAAEHEMVFQWLDSFIKGN